ncbi:hypothetical protein QJS10_CPB22g00863 [Acorus calamus]|uniref:Uncharacterized protein n=1 Tax=Acorus calamus TaxID=4465 RepID=A0AAV9C2A3_ACOCL|nr:hypothetical protein QJS10_CPB22g00863 [Acorus calamus]
MRDGKVRGSTPGKGKKLAEDAVVDVAEEDDARVGAVEEAAVGRRCKKDRGCSGRWQRWSPSRSGRDGHRRRMRTCGGQGLKTENRVGCLISEFDIISQALSSEALNSSIEEDSPFLRYGYLSPSNVAAVNKEAANLCRELRPHELVLDVNATKLKA